MNFKKNIYISVIFILNLTSTNVLANPKQELFITLEKTRKCFSYKTFYNFKRLFSDKIEEASDSLEKSKRHKQVLIIGGGQSGLAVSYFLQRYKVDYIILDQENNPGGAWQHGWNSLHLFSPARWSSLPGWVMPSFSADEYPSRDQVINYLASYEKKYRLLVERPVRVKEVKKIKDLFLIETDKGQWRSEVLISATGKWSNPFVPDYPKMNLYQGLQIHSAYYQNPEKFLGRRVLIVGGGNSAAQILSEVSKVANTTWVTLDPPKFLPDDVDGRILFERATQKWEELKRENMQEMPKGSLGDIVMVPAVKDARERGVLRSLRPFSHFYEHGVVWKNGVYTPFDAVIWCTGFNPALNHLQNLGIVEPKGIIKVNETRSIKEPNLWLVGYGDWTGYASATLLGITRTARSTAKEIAETLNLG